MGSGALSNVWSQAERLSSSCVLEPTPHYPVYQSRSPARPRLTCSSSSSSNSRIVAIVIVDSSNSSNSSNSRRGSSKSSSSSCCSSSSKTSNRRWRSGLSPPRGRRSPARPRADRQHGSYSRSPARKLEPIASTTQAGTILAARLVMW